MKHTSGNWQIDQITTQRFTKDLSDAIVVHNGKTDIAYVQDYSEPYKQEEELANAKLIAAAPDLLEACKEAKDYLSVKLREPERKVFWKLVGAIKKATS